MKTRHVIPCSAALLVAAAAGAEELHELAPVLVESDQPLTLPPATAPAHSRFALPASVEASEILSRDDIEAIRPRDVYDLIEGSLGMTISRQGARVHNFSYDRGDSVSVILDGVYLTQTEAQRILGDLAPELIESVRFLRDSTVLTIGPLMGFGSASAGSPNQGFILIDTRKGGPGKDGSEVVTGYGSYNTWKAGGFHGHSWKDGRYSLGLGYHHAESKGKPDWNNAYEGDSWLLNGGLNDPGLTALASLYVNQAARNIQRAVGTYTGSTNYPVSGPTPDGILDKNIWKYDPMDTTAFSLNVARPWNDRHTTAFTYGWTEAKGAGYYYTTTTAPATVSGKDSRDRAEEMNLSHTIADRSNTLKVGAQTVTWYQLSEGNPAAREEKVVGIYATDEIRITPGWSVDGAFRRDHKKIVQGGDKYLSDGSTARLSGGEWTDEATLFSVGSAWQINPTWRISGRYAFNRTPTPDVITTRNDQSLPAEERRRYELGLDADLGSALRIGLTPFYYDLKNAKVSDGSITKDASGNDVIDDATGQPTSITVYKAADRVRKGFELSLKGRLGSDAYRYEFGWTHFADDGQNGITGSEFPDNKFSARISGRHGPWEAHLSLLKVDPYLSYGYTVGDFTTVNLSASRRFARGLIVTVYAQNLTNEHYGTNNKGYPATANWGVLRDVGATYGIEARIKFQ